MKLEDLSRILRETDPAAVLVADTVLARVVQNMTGMAWAVWRVPHAHCYVIDRFNLFKHVDQDELHLPPDHPLPDRVLLLERPTADQLNGNQNELLGRYWRLLFHAMAHRELEQRLADLTPAGLRERVERLGPAAFEEARNVLIQDGLLAAKATDKDTYVEFAAYFLELRFFNPNLLPVCFPSLPPVPEVEAILAREADGAGLFAASRLPGAPDPSPKTDDQSDESHDFYRRLARAAVRAGKAADTVGAAILHTRAARVAPAAETLIAQHAARQDIYRLVERLQQALHLTDDEAAHWRRVLPTLLDKADQGARPVEAALLYDLQRACMDHDETIYALDVFEWAWSLGKKPIKRELKTQRYVRIPAQLRSATRRLAAARLSDADRQALAALLRDAQNGAEKRLRDKFGPMLDEALQDAGLRPTTLPEKAALSKTVGELLDRISSAGYLGFADVRDAIARGQMKLPDLGAPSEYVRGDPLLRLDRRLAHKLDGVYRGAESYTRGLERLTAFSFGTRTGRWLTRNVTLPFGGAFLVAEFFWLLMFERLGERAREAGEAEPSFFGGWNAAWWFHAAWVAGGVFLLIAIRSAEVQAALLSAGRGVYRAVRYVFWDLPSQVWAHPAVRTFLATVPAQLAINWGLKPLVLSGLLWVLFHDQLWVSGGEPAWPARVITLVACAAVINTRPGRALEAALLEVCRTLLEVIRAGPAVLRWINDLFRDMVDALEWTLARVEDWLRIRGRGGPVAVAVRAVAGVLWMPFAFLIRFYTVVLIEPMVNPLKLPLSILFAKFIYPLLAVLGLFTIAPEVGSPLVKQLAPVLSWPVAWLLVIGTFYLLPDAVTFLFWEMRENWRLYKANRPTAVRPVSVGPHGETVEGLLHWGFHSGTVPRLFAKLRAAEREAARTDNWRDARTYRANLRLVEEAVRRFVTRDFIAVLDDRESRWGGPGLCVGRVNLGTNRIRLELVPDDKGEPAWLEWEDRSGWLVAGWAEPGFLTDLPAGPTRALENALTYLYKRAGVDLVREQLGAVLRDAGHFDVGPDGLLVWYGSREAPPVLYDLADPVDELRPRTPDGRHPAPGRSLKADRVLFSRVQLTWSQWVEVWRPDLAAGPRPRFGPPDFEWTLLPPRSAPPEEAAPMVDVLPPPLPPPTGNGPPHETPPPLPVPTETTTAPEGLPMPPPDGPLPRSTPGGLTPANGATPSPVVADYTEPSGPQVLPSPGSPPLLEGGAGPVSGEGGESREAGRAG